MKKTIQIFIVTIIAALAVSGCKTKQVVVPTVHFRDSTKIVYTRDSVYLHDSVFVAQYQKGDTVYRDRVRTKYLYKYVGRTDTVAIERRDTVKIATPVAQSLTMYQRMAARWFSIVCALLIVLLAWTFRRPIVAVIKKIIA